MRTITGIIKSARICGCIDDKLLFSAKIQLEGNRKHVRTRPRPSLNPEWNRDFELIIDGVEQTIIELILFGWYDNGPTIVIDQVSISLEDIVQTDQSDHWIPLKKNIGEICLCMGNDNRGSQAPNCENASSNFQGSKNCTHQEYRKTDTESRQPRVNNTESESIYDAAQCSPTALLNVLCDLSEKAQILLSRFISVASSDLQAKYNDSKTKLQEAQSKYDNLNAIHTDLRNEHNKLQALYKNACSQLDQCKNENDKEKGKWEHQIAIYKDTNTRLQREKENSERKLIGDIQDLKSHLQEEHFAAQDAKDQLNIEIARINEMNKKMKAYEAEIIDYKKRNRDLPCTNIEIGAYEYGGITPATIEEHWRYMFSELLRTFIQGFKNAGPCNLFQGKRASESYRILVYHSVERDTIRPRFQAYVVIREVSQLLSLTSRTVIIKEDDTITEANKKDFLLDLMTQTGTEAHSRQEIAKILLDKLVNPNDLTHKTTDSFFDKLSDPLKEYLDEFFKVNLRRLKEIVNDYFTVDNDTYNILGIFLYTAIYVAVEISTISDNTIMAYWSSCCWDKELFNVQTDDDYFIRVPQRENFYDEFERVPLLEPEPEAQTPFLLFSIFPGCAYFDGSGHVRVISKCRVVCAGPD